MDGMAWDLTINLWDLSVSKLNIMKNVVLGLNTYVEIYVYNVEHR